jgi:transcriptional regulator with XRE-family HTH domain
MSGGVRILEQVKRTKAPFVDELPRLLAERSLSIRELSRSVGVSDSHLSRILRRAGYKTVSPDLARRIAMALGLDEGYFVEAREGFVFERIRRSPRLRDRLYDELHG